MAGETLWAVVVARAGVRAKSRLAEVLSGPERQALALAMLADVLEVCGAAHLAGTVAVVDVPAAQAVAERAGAVVCGDPGRGDMNAAVASGIAVASARGATTVVVLPGDIPLLAAEDLATLAAAAAGAPRTVVLGASHDGLGTNALLLRPPTVIAPAFGPPSLARHAAAARAAGALTVVRTGLGLASDLDTPADLARLRLAGGVGRHTAAALAAQAAGRTLL